MPISSIIFFKEVKMKHLFFVLSLCFCFVAFAQTPPFAQRDAVYLATLKAVLDYKMEDAENIKQLEKLRQNKKFNRDLQKKLEKLNNKKTKSAQNERIYNTLKNAGKKIYNELN